MDIPTGIWCSNCQHPIPTEVIKTATPGILCFGCTLQSEEERSSVKGSQWSYLLNHWHAEGARILHWLRNDFHSTELLTCLCSLARYYNFNDVVPMVNSMALERLRHKSAPGIYVRHVIESDFHDALVLAKKWRLRPMGQPRAPRYGYNVGVCKDGQDCKNVLPLEDRIVVTEAYRLRKGCNMIYAQ
ncbi:hypothetical protein GL218_00806 [Daldinia childiae]|uniref:uncharacterized protein n=1 Tax=Daldinia childiae TaxID=326645 RepID=UPI001446A1B2|nr:uncharacterized protein GL218_00806 [Daldinia childiae]KAF3070948.1 hypothetical protein GL218_00806 [Daldinia childiae]